MNRCRQLLALAGAAALAITLASHVSAAPQIGYAYPAGGRQGTTFTVEVGGQSLRDADLVRISGDGVRASVVEYVRTLDNEEMRDAERFLRDLVRREWVASVKYEADKNADGPPLPDHPWLRDLDEKSPYELACLRTRLFDPKKQPNAQIAEKVMLEVTIAPDATPGDRELRVMTPAGLSNPLRFQVGTLPELLESEFAGGAEARVVETPALLNGQILPGEVDRIRIRAREGQRLVARLQARALIPYLADAVPGWFQATLALYGPGGARVAFSDDFRFNPDPVLLYDVPADGVYELEVRDAIYRGREDFVYRIAVGELPFVTGVFPLGGREGSSTVASLDGWNLPTEALALDTEPGRGEIRQASLPEAGGVCNEIRYAVDTLPETIEAEPNDDASEPQEITFPQVVNGLIAQPGDVDIFRFDGEAGQQVVAEIHARRLNSPLDSVVRLLAPSGDVVALNDDHKDPAMGLVTHHADSHLLAQLPEDGAYRVCVSDATHSGGQAHAYRLTIRPPRPDFALRLVPSGINVPAGRSAPVELHALRTEGFDGAITLALVDAPEGFTLSQAAIPAGEEKVQATLTAPRGIPRLVAPISVQGTAEIGGATVTRPAVPAEDQMQAFLWRFLVPQQELLVAVTGSRPVPAVWQPLVPGVELTSAAPVRLPLGGTATVHVHAPEVLPEPAGVRLEAVRFRLGNHPRGITLRGANSGANGVTLTLKADANICMAGDTSNVIVEAFTEPQPGADSREARVSLGVLPAIPFEVVRP